MIHLFLRAYYSIQIDLVTFVNPICCCKRNRASRLLMYNFMHHTVYSIMTFSSFFLYVHFVLDVWLSTHTCSCSFPSTPCFTLIEFFIPWSCQVQLHSSTVDHWEEPLEGFRVKCLAQEHLISSTLLREVRLLLFHFAHPYFPSWCMDSNKHISRHKLAYLTIKAPIYFWPYWCRVVVKAPGLRPIRAQSWWTKSSSMSNCHTCIKDESPQEQDTQFHQKT